MNDNYKQALAFLGGAAVGATAAFLITKKVLEKKFDNELTEQVALAKEHYSKRSSAVIINTEQPYASPDEAAEALLQPYLPTMADDPRPSVDEVVKDIQSMDRNLFEDEPDQDEYDTSDDAAYGIPDFIYEDEVKKRTALLPYVITDEEFAEGHPGHEQFSLTYYEGDKVLADDKDEVVSDIINTVGQENLLKFGHGSNDSRIVYIRNEKRHVDFEVIQHDGNYADMIGLTEHNRTGRG